MDSLTENAIASSVGCSHNTVKNILAKAEANGLTYEDAKGMDDTQINTLIYPSKYSTERVRPEPDMVYIHGELKRPNVNLSLLWHEYKQEHPDGVGYTQFCERYRKYIGSRKVSMHIQHKAGEKMYVDWAGDTMCVIDSSNGEVHAAYLFVSAVGCSGYPYVEAFPSKDKKCFIQAHINAFKHYGALPSILVPDNDKSAVTKADRYEPDINKTYNEMAQHYGVAVLPARVRKPKDKPKVESTVGNIETWIMAALRNEVFNSFKELNCAIWQKLAEYSAKPFQKKEDSRFLEFLTYDLPAMRPLPPCHYEFSDWLTAKVNCDYHIEAEKQLYSVPYSYVGKQADVSVSLNCVEIFVNGIRIASHPRLTGRLRQYSTLPEHMPENHKAYASMSKETVDKWAAEVGKYTVEMISHVFGRVKIPEQAYRSCMGLKRVCKTYGTERFEAACKMSLDIQGYGSSYIERILKAGLDLKQQAAESPIMHQNIRGQSYYASREEVNDYAHKSNCR
jgi:transposase